ncbi:hypothetical protein [Saccharospirillum mangrovi]|uniref:hypothetical protein n=1 Tax=Saccharospirillum mangrovi TaxID=2161747 RepID=UPI000D3903AC|nr:hypothetical protein [Saccharospirillum mangrovi]
MAALSKLFTNKNNTDDKTQATQSFSPTDLAERSHSADRRQRQAALAELANRLEDGRLPSAELDQLGLDPLDQFTLQLQNPDDLNRLSADECLQLALRGFSAQVRNLAAEQLTEPEQLEQLARAAKGHDKTVYRIARDKLDAQRTLAREQQADLEQAQTVVERLERHAEASFDPLYAGKLKALTDQWQDCQRDADEALTARFETARQTAQSRLDERSDVSEPEPEQETPVELEADAEPQPFDPDRLAIFERVLEELRERTDAPEFDDALLREAQHDLTEQQHRWRESEAASRPGKDEERAFHRLCTAFETALTHQLAIVQRFGPLEALLQRLEESPEKMHAEAQALDEWLHELDWPADYPAPQLKGRVEQALARHHDQLAEHHKLEIQSIRQARALMRRCQAAVSEGHLRRASGLLHGIEDELAALKAAAHPGLFR